MCHQPSFTNIFRCLPSCCSRITSQPCLRQKVVVRCPADVLSLTSSWPSTAYHICLVKRGRQILRVRKRTSQVVNAHGHGSQRYLLHYSRRHTNSITTFPLFLRNVHCAAHISDDGLPTVRSTTVDPRLRRLRCVQTLGTSGTEHHLTSSSPRLPFIATRWINVA